MKVEQQIFLRHALDRLDLSRAQFAKLFDISKRTLDAWLLPSGSSGFRDINPEAYRDIAQALRDKTIRENLNMTRGDVSFCVKPVRCDDFSFHFPSVYRVTNHLIGESGEVLEKQFGYSLSPEASSLPYANMQAVDYEPIDKMVPGIDSGLLFVKEHRTIDRLDAYVLAIYEMMPEAVCMSLQTVEWNGHFFTIYHIPKPLFDKEEYPNAKDCVIRYDTDKYAKETPEQLAKQLGNIIETTWTFIMGPDGVIDDDLYGEYEE